MFTQCKGAQLQYFHTGIYRKCCLKDLQLITIFLIFLACSFITLHIKKKISVFKKMILAQPLKFTSNKILKYQMMVKISWSEAQKKKDKLVLLDGAFCFHRPQFSVEFSVCSCIYPWCSCSYFFPVSSV